MNDDVYMSAEIRYEFRTEPSQIEGLLDTILQRVVLVDKIEIDRKAVATFTDSIEADVFKKFVNEGGQI